MEKKICIPAVILAMAICGQADAKYNPPANYITNSQKTACISSTCMTRTTTAV